MPKYNPDKEPVIVCDPIDPYRQTGRTTRQLMRLPKGAWFFSPNVDYHQHLARSNGRWDIVVKHVSLLSDDNCHKLRGQRAIAADMDHYLLISPKFIEHRRNFANVVVPQVALP